VNDLYDWFFGKPIEFEEYKFYQNNMLKKYLKIHFISNKNHKINIYFIFLFLKTP
jgi:hypothetical protein